MPGINEDRERQVVPLWRSFGATILRGELAPLTPAPETRFSDEMVRELVEDWKERPTLSVAADLVSAAATLGRFSAATDAAEFVITHPNAPPAAANVAAYYLRRADLNPEAGSGAVEPEEGVGVATLTKMLHSEVRQTRSRLIEYPRNPILWINLSRLYTSLGVQDKATRAMRTALAMAPENRFVLRAASRLLLHQGKKGEAHWLLANAPVVRADPWLLASEIATAAAGGRTSRNIKAARKVLDAQRQSPFHLSELASALGTLESLAGNVKNARQLIGLSLRQPADNSIAQAAWLQRNVGGIAVSENALTQSLEANTWFAWMTAKWDVALSEAERWQAEQPFSSRPAIIGSHIASTVVEDYDRAVAFTRQGLLSNPDDFALQNNLAFALAMRGDIYEARQQLRKIDADGLNELQRVVLKATSGLVAFRMGDLEKGRSLYRSAIAGGKRLRDKREAIAKIYYAFEELRIRSPEAEAVRQEAIEGAKELTEPPYIALVDRLKRHKPL